MLVTKRYEKELGNSELKPVLTSIEDLLSTVLETLETLFYFIDIILTVYILTIIKNMHLLREWALTSYYSFLSNLNEPIGNLNISKLNGIWS